jgi:hypothetical protein
MWRRSSSSDRWVLALGLLLLARTLAAGAGENYALTKEGPMAWKFSASFETKAPSWVTWEALTDYDHLERFSKSLVSSKVLERKGPYVVLEQKARAVFLIFSKTYTLSLLVHEELRERLDFQELTHLDFEEYRGSWSLTPLPDGGTSVTYEVRAGFKKSGLEHWLGGQGLSAGATTQVHELRRELDRRALACTGASGSVKP